MLVNVRAEILIMQLLLKAKNDIKCNKQTNSSFIFAQFVLQLFNALFYICYAVFGKSGKKIANKYITP